MCVLERQIAKVDSETNTFFRPHRTNIPIDRELGTEADRVVVIDPQCGWAEEDLRCLRVGYSDISLQKSIGTLAHKFTKQSPVPFVRRSPPLGRPIFVHQAVVEMVRSPITVVFGKLGESRTEPHVMTE